MNQSVSKATNRNRVFIGVAWPYVNGDLHIGHYAGYLLPADIYARYHRLIGNEVLMVSGSDCHGTPITVEADKRGKTPQEIVEEYHAKDVDLFTNKLGLTYDIYTRTDTQHHIEIVQDFFLKLLDADYIFIDKTEQYYSPADERFLPDRYIQGICPYCGYAEARSDQCDNCGKLLEQGEVRNPVSRLSAEEVSLRETEHYFLDWSKFQPIIEKYVEEKGHIWKKWVRQETLGWLKEGLKPRALTRDLDWGIPLPVDRIPPDKLIENIEHKRIYVWYEAVMGYYSASLLWTQETGKDWKPFWFDEAAQHYYFMGKDNLVFHTILWPGLLSVYDPELHLPDVLSINMFLNLEGKQFSKSRGVSIEIDDMVGRYGNDVVRFYLTYIMPETKDASFYWKDFQDKVNKVLIGTIGNFIHRSLSLGFRADISRIIQIKLKELRVEKDGKKVIDWVEEKYELAKRSIEKCEFRKYLYFIEELASAGNWYLDCKKVWELKKSETEEFYAALKSLYFQIVVIAHLMMPVMPKTATTIFNLLGLEPPKGWPAPGEEAKSFEEMVNQIDTNIKPKPLFKRIEEESIAESYST